MLYFLVDKMKMSKESLDLSPVILKFYQRHFLSYNY
jgi:hypothetical protein